MHTIIPLSRSIVLGLWWTVAVYKVNNQMIQKMNKWETTEGRRPHLPVACSVDNVWRRRGVVEEQWPIKDANLNLSLQSVGFARGSLSGGGLAA